MRLHRRWPPQKYRIRLEYYDPASLGSKDGRTPWDLIARPYFSLGLVNQGYLLLSKTSIWENNVTHRVLRFFVWLKWRRTDLHTSVLLASPGNTLNAGKVKGFPLHPHKNEIQCLNPHSHWGIHLVFNVVGVNTLLDIVMREVGIKGNYLLVLGFKVN